MNLNKDLSYFIWYQFQINIIICDKVTHRLPAFLIQTGPSDSNILFTRKFSSQIERTEETFLTSFLPVYF